MKFRIGLLIFLLAAFTFAAASVSVTDNNAAVLVLDTLVLLAVFPSFDFWSQRFLRDDT